MGYIELAQKETGKALGHGVALIEYIERIFDQNLEKDEMKEIENMPVDMYLRNHRNVMTRLDRSMVLGPLEENCEENINLNRLLAELIKVSKQDKKVEMEE
jgi:hypothetical protein